jgi:hypothetical protein
MTTIAFDGTYLAADTRTTHGGGAPETDRSRRCPSCDGHADTTFSYSRKIERTYPRKPVLLEGEKVLAWATAGCGSMGRAFDRAMKAGLDLKEVSSVVAAVHNHGGHALVVTENSVYDIEFGKVWKCKKIEQLPYAIGSGGKVATFAMKRLGYSAMGAVACAADVDKSTGGDINYYNCRWANPEAEIPPTIETINYTEEELFGQE